MKRSVIIFFLLLFPVWLCASPVSAQQEQTVIAQINKTVGTLRSMSCSFTQTKHLSLLSDKMVSEGKMYYSRPNKLRWEYTKPYQYLFLFNGRKVYVGNKSRKDVIDTNSNRIFKEVARLMMGTVTGTALSNQTDFSISIEDGKTAWNVTLTPKKKEIKKMFSKIMMAFNKSDMMISEINIFEKNGDRTNIKMSNVKINGTINEALFTIPK